MVKLTPITRRSSLKRGDRIFRINTGLGRFGNEREFVHATVLRGHTDPQRIIVRFDNNDQPVSVAWRRFHRA